MGEQQLQQSPLPPPSQPPLPLPPPTARLKPTSAVGSSTERETNEQSTMLVESRFNLTQISAAIVREIEGR